MRPLSTPLHQLLARRERLVFLEPGGGPDERTADMVERLEGRAAELGYVFSCELYGAFFSMPSPALASAGDALVELLRAERGAHVPHVPQLRKFPHTTPQDTHELYLERMLAHVFTSPEQPCLNCANLDKVWVLDPCGHLVCGSCWDGSDYSGCPICHRRIALDSPFLRPAPPREPDSTIADGRTLTLLDLGLELEAVAERVYQSLLARATPLNRQDREDLVTLVRTQGVERLPDTIPVRETMALVLGTWLEFDIARRHIRTAPDLLRVLFVHLGGEPDLLTAPKPMPSLPRPLRRFVMQTLETLAPETLIEDLRRHAEHWKRIGEKLHPFEHAVRYPNTAAAFAVIRRTRVEDDFVLPDGGAATVTRERVRPRTWATQIEEALAAQDLELALELAQRRPGELVRRLDHLLREGAPASQTIVALQKAAPNVSPAVLLTALAALRARTRRLPQRVFFPRGDVTRAFATRDARPLLPAATVDAVVNTIHDELLRRARWLPRFDAAILDEQLRDLPVPSHERHAARSLVAVPRGSTLPIPDGDQLRLFVHWTEPEGTRVDLDLSVALYDASWRMQGLCDYTSLAFRGDAARHSGDLTSAPAPLGASEFVDLDLDALRTAGIRHLVMVVFSYNNVAFDQMTDAFAGFMSRRDARGEIFDPRTVEQRFDLQGNARNAVPMIVDLEARTLLWADVNMAAAGLYHSVGGYRAALAHLAQDLHAYFGARTRPTLYELACLHAAARAQRVVVRTRDGALVELEPQLDRLLDGEGAPVERVPDGPVFAALVRGDIPLAPGSVAYALHPDRAGVPLLAASDLAAQLRAL